MIAENNKAHAISTGLSQYIADFRLATLPDVVGHNALESLLSNGVLNSVIYLDRDITIFTGALAGERQLDTAGTIGLLKVNNQAEIDSPAYRLMITDVFLYLILIYRALLSLAR